MKRLRLGQKDGDELIFASEIACWAYCPEQWRLQYGMGLDPENRATLKAGTQHHARKAVAERIAGGTITLGRLVAVLAVVVLLLLLWRWL
jgi:hypothetical protein